MTKKYANDKVRELQKYTNDKVRERSSMRMMRTRMIKYANDKVREWQKLNYRLSIKTQAMYINHLLWQRDSQNAR